MGTFKEYVKSKDDNLNEMLVGGIKRKPWQASRKQIIQYWTSLRNDIPIRMTPISPTHHGSTYSEDGIRITGSANFITSILARLKEILSHDTQNAKLNLVYRETEASTKLPSGSPDASYAFYLNLRQKKLEP